MAEKEYIEREAAIEKIRVIYCGECNSYNGVRCRACEFDDAMSLIEDVPAADVAPVVHARWKDNHCTACGMMPMGEELWDSCDFAPPMFEYFMDFCPHCGARMDGGTEKPYKLGIKLLELQCKKFTETCEQVIEESVFMQKIREFKGDQT